MSLYSWKKKIFSSQTTIYQGNSVIGFFTIGMFMKGYMELLGQSYTFKRTGFWGNKYEVYKENEKTPIAKLTFHHLGLSTKIEYKNSIYEMVYRSIFLTSFDIYHQEKSIYTYNASSYKGKLSTDREDSLLITLGIYSHVKRIMNN